MLCRRALHFVLKIGNRNEAVGFYKNVLGMKVMWWRIQQGFSKGAHGERVRVSL